MKWLELYSSNAGHEKCNEAACVAILTSGPIYMVFSVIAGFFVGVSFARKTGATGKQEQYFLIAATTLTAPMATPIGLFLLHRKQPLFTGSYTGDIRLFEQRCRQ